MECRFLKADAQAECRSMTDAIEVLRSEVHFGDADQAMISIAPLPIATCARSVGLLFKTRQLNCVLLPAAEQIGGVAPGETRRQLLDVNRFQGAVVDNASTVKLTDGTSLRAVEVMPADLPWKLTALDRRIIKFALDALGLQEAAYLRSLREGVPERYCETVPDLRGWDFAKLAQVRAPAFKVFQRYLERERSHFSVSRQKYFEALTKVGMCASWPRGRRRASADG